MWSNVHGCKEPERDRSPNHFVPLLKMCPDMPVMDDDGEEEFPSFDADFFGDGTDLNSSIGSIVNNIIQGLDVEVKIFLHKKINTNNCI